MPLPPELQQSADQTQDLNRWAADERKRRRGLETDRSAVENDKINRVVAWGRAVAQAALDEGVPIDTYTTDTSYSGELRLPLSTPSRKEATSPHDIDRHTISPHSTTRENGSRPFFLRNRSLRLKKGEVATGTHITEGWLLTTTTNVSRTIGVLLTTDGGLELFDLPGNMEQDVSKTDAEYLDTSGGRVMKSVLLNRSVYMRDINERRSPGMGKHNHTVFLSDFHYPKYPLPDIVQKICDESTVEHFNGLQAIEQGLVNFVINNGLS